MKGQEKLSYNFGLRLEKYRELKKVINLCINNLIFLDAVITGSQWDF